MHIGAEHSAYNGLTSGVLLAHDERNGSAVLYANRIKISFREMTL